LFGELNAKDRLYDAVEDAISAAKEDGLKCEVDDDVIGLIVVEVLDALKELDPEDLGFEDPSMEP
jgi:hypothetical protein